MRQLLLKEDWSSEKIEQLLSNLQVKPDRSMYSEADLAILNFAGKLTTLSTKIVEADVDNLRSVGFDDKAVHDICAIVAYFNFVNRMAEGLGVELEARFHEE